MIKLDGQFTYIFNLGEEKDFINIENLTSFRLYENAGNCRPLLKMSFRLDNSRLLPYLNQGNLLTISFGIDQPDKEVMQFIIYEDESNVDYSLGAEVPLKAYLYIPNLTDNNTSESFLDNTSIQVLKKIAHQNNLNFITNISITDDRQDWYRQGVSQWKFLDEVWLHSYINDRTFQSFAWDAKNMYFYDMRKKCSTADWIFTNLGASGTNIVPIGTYTTKNHSGITNELIGKNLKLCSYNIDTNKLSNEEFKLKNFTAIYSDKLNINNTDCLDYAYYIINDDDHKNYVKAFNQNLRNNVLYNSFYIFTSTGLKFRQLKLLDTVTFQLYPNDIRLAGTSIISSIVYEYQQGKFNINITLNKEAPSGLIGNNLLTGE